MIITFDVEIRHWGLLGAVGESSHAAQARVLPVPPQQSIQYQIDMFASLATPS